LILLYILYGEDDFSLGEALDKIKGELGDREMVATNTNVLQGQHLSPEQLISICDTMPFLAPKRLVVVEGLLSRFEQQDSKGKRAPSSEALGWQSLKDYITQMPESTVLVLIDGRLRKDNPMLAKLGSQAKLMEFKSIKGDELRSWIQSRMTKTEGRISPRALRLLSDLIGSNLQLLSMEIDKLCLYTQGRMIEENDVESLVTEAGEFNVFDMVDAILDRRTEEAIRLLHRLEDGGSAPPYLLFMITRQFRLVIQAKDLQQQRRKADEIRRTLGITKDFILQKTMKQSRVHSMERLNEIYRKLLDTDIYIKTGRFKGDGGALALDLLICELCEERA
jgi:DNA polymerase-3 subunit delta